jgi:hypothetical protein
MKGAYPSYIITRKLKYWELFEKLIKLWALYPGMKYIANSIIGAVASEYNGKFWDTAWYY